MACIEFITVATSFASAWIAINFLQNDLYLLVKYILLEEDRFFLFTLLIQVFFFLCFRRSSFIDSIFQGFSVLSLFFWSWLSRKIGKKKTALIGGVIFIPTCFAFGLLPAHAVLFACLLCVLGGMGVGNMLLMPWSMLPDVMEIDEIKCGYRREGIFYSWFVLFQKIGLGLATGLSSLILGWAGYISPSQQHAGNVSQPDSVILTLRLFMSVVPAVLFSICLVAIWLNPVTRATHAEATAKAVAQRAKVSETEIVEEVEGQEELAVVVPPIEEDENNRASENQ